MTGATAPFVLPPGVIISPADQLPEAVRLAAGAQSGDFVVTRPRGRGLAKVVDEATSELLLAFREPLSITDAIINFSSRRRIDPERTLIEAFPLLTDLVQNGFLVPADSPRARAIVPSLELGTRVLGFEVVSCIQVLEDTELYQARDASSTHAALKLVGMRGSVAATTALEHEAVVLAILDGQIGPRLLGAGSIDDRHFLLTEWFWGVSPDAAARDLHAAPAGPDRAGLLRLACAVLDAYAALHARGIVHGDVHPRNILVDGSGRVSLVDFALARILFDPASEPSRGGVPEFLEPELVRAATAGAPTPATELGEQYALGALLFRVLAGSRYLDLSLREDEAYRQIEHDPPRSFPQCGVAAWPDVEQVLTRALDKNPARRHPSVRDFAERLGRARVTNGRRPAGRSGDHFAQLLSRVGRRMGVDGPLLREGLRSPPLASINFGAAGLAWAAYRLACIQDRAGWLSLAEVWLQRSQAMLDHPDAFLDPAAGMTRELIGEVSVLHGPCGVHCVDATLAASAGDWLRHARAVDAFVAASQPARGDPDLAFGAAGTLVASALLHEAPGPMSDARRSLRALGDRTLDEVTRWMDAHGPVGACPELRNLGIAHGWAGVLFAVLRWCEASGRSVPPSVEDRLMQLADCGEPIGRGLRWRWHDSGHDAGAVYMPGWCNGAAGFVFLWTAAHRICNEPRFHRLAELAAWEAWDSPAPARSLCCGSAGRAYALLALYRHSGDPAWLDRAWQIAGHAARHQPSGEDAQLIDSLYKGDVGVALLAADLDRPLEACMPFFESEGWPRGMRESPDA